MASLDCEECLEITAFPERKENVAKTEIKVSTDFPERLECLERMGSQDDKVWTVLLARKERWEKEDYLDHAELQENQET